MNIKHISLLLAAAALTACSDYLETSSVSKADGDFVFSSMQTGRAAMDGAYSAWHEAMQTQVFGDGLFYALDIAGSDIMRHPEGYAKQPARHNPETLFEGGTGAATYNNVSYVKDDKSGAYPLLFSVVGIANSITSAIEGMATFDPNADTDINQLYGEAVCMHATAYRELMKYFGDVPYQAAMGAPATGLAPRDSIYDVIIARVLKAAQHMKPVGAKNKNYFSSTYAYALAGRLALEAAGYQTRRPDIRYTDGAGNPLTFEQQGTPGNAGATYGRRTDYKTLYQTAKKAYEDAMANLGACAFDENDYATFFNELHGDDNGFATESIYEEPYSQNGGNDARPYSLGRPSSGGSSKAFPCKNYGQGRIQPAFYYGVFDPRDQRRDLAATVTGSNGKGYEVLIPFKPDSKAVGGGIASNKFDECRQKNVCDKQRSSGINAPYMRLSEVYLGYAEACAVLGDDATAKQYLAKTRNRAFGGNGNVDDFVQKEGSTFEAVIDERGFEFAGEGDRRFTLVRSGLLAKKVQAIKQLTRQMTDALSTQGYYTFDNGNTISAYIYTKAVDPLAAPYNLTSRYVAAATDDTNPVAYPGWRGQHDWELDTFKGNTKSNLAIQGLFKPVTPAEEAQLLADGYQKVEWGKTIVDNDQEYNDYVFYKWDYQSAPIHLFPFAPNTIATGGFHNAYGFTDD